LLDTPVNRLAQFAPGSTVLSSLTDTQEWMAVFNKLRTVGGSISWMDCPRTPSTITSSTFGSPYATSTVSLWSVSGISRPNCSWQASAPNTVANNNKPVRTYLYWFF